MQGRDDWDTDPDFVNDVSEKESRWGSKTVEGSGLQGAIDLEKVRQDTIVGDMEGKKRMQSASSQPSHGYGGRFGVMKDRMDKSAESWNYKGATEKHPSQVDYSYGFGGKFGVQTDRQDKCALGWDHREKLAVHESQKGPKIDIKGNISHDWLSANCDTNNIRKPPRSIPVWKNGVEAVKQRKQLLEGAAQQRTGENIVSCGNSDERQEALKNELSLCKASSLKEKFEKLAVKNATPQVDRPKPGKLPAWNVQKNASPPCNTKVDNENEVNANGQVMQDNNREMTSDYKQQSNVDDMQGNDTNVENDEDWPTDEPDVSDDMEPCPRWQPAAAAAVSNSEYNREAEDKDDLKTVAIEDHPLSDAPGETLTSCNREFSGDDKLQPVDSHPLGQPEHPMADTGIRAIALYDYTAGDFDEISFEPDDIISNIDMVDADWWRGMCRGQYGLFPANYVELCP
ncbi:src substrate cortactin; repeat in hs cortactin [Trichuris trichiura]|uniref:Src substrate cortactin repeat in hs cortactin n=1 Tax=Trichuris trichiura TaxID=36087 RepID=A0A077YVI8_TRITR|nr:src substrate cortactin; repeat in hs cortactin [Trichuris trichiura]